MKWILYFTVFCIFFLSNIHAYSQIKNDSSVPKQTDTSGIINTKNLPSNKDTSRIIRKHKIFTKVDSLRKNKKTDSLIIKSRLVSINVDSSNNNPAKDTLKIPDQSSVKNYRNIINELLSRNKFINVKDVPVYFIEEGRHPTGEEFLFYALCIVVLLLGIIKTFYSQYFNNLFRVFFNTSLRQTQLTDRLCKRSFLRLS